MFFNRKDAERLSRESEELAERLDRERKERERGKPFRSAAGLPVRCLHCGHDRFREGKALLNSRGLTFLDLEWLNDSAVTLECANCGFILWFTKDVKAEEGNPREG